MITNILIGAGCFTVGVFVGAYYMTKKIIAVSTMYKELTGNDFIKWIQDTSAKKGRELFDKKYGSKN